MRRDSIKKDDIIKRDFIFSNHFEIILDDLFKELKHEIISYEWIKNKYTLKIKFNLYHIDNNINPIIILNEIKKNNFKSKIILNNFFSDGSIYRMISMNDAVIFDIDYANKGSYEEKEVMSVEASFLHDTYKITELNERTNKI